jgi:hypothetical protein
MERGIRPDDATAGGLSARQYAARPVRNRSSASGLSVRVASEGRRAGAPAAAAGVAETGGAPDGATELLLALRRAAHPGAPAALADAGESAAAAVGAVRFELGSFLDDAAGGAALAAASVETGAGSASAASGGPPAPTPQPPPLPPLLPTPPPSSSSPPPPPSPPWHEADIVFVNATAFDERLLHALHLKSERMRAGALLILTTQKSPSKLFELVHEEKCVGRATRASAARRPLSDSHDPRARAHAGTRRVGARQ